MTSEKKFRTKSNNSSERVLTVLKILLKKQTSIKDILKVIQTQAEYNNIYTKEVIVKYLETLKFSGFEICRSKNKYFINQYLQPINLDEDDLYAFKKLIDYVSELNDGKLKTDFLNFFHIIECNFSETTKNIIFAENKKFKIRNLYASNHSCVQKSIDLLIQKLEKYCLEEFHIKLTYLKSGVIEQYTVIPKEILYKKHKPLLRAYNPSGNVYEEYLLEFIKDVEQLSIKLRTAEIATTVTFNVTGRLIKAYKMRENENVIFKNEEIMTIVNKNEDKKSFLKRILKYGENAEILSPKSYRDEFLEMVNNCLQFYS